MSYYPLPYQSNQQVSASNGGQTFAGINLGNVQFDNSIGSQNIVNIYNSEGATPDQCLHDLKVTDPREDRTRIQYSKDKLLKNCYAWILDDPSFQRWRTQDDSRLLWIKGDPGKGKTMMMMGLIDELSPLDGVPLSSKTMPRGEQEHSSQPNSKLDLLAYFFCQSTRPELSNATSVLRGLIYLLVAEREHLLQYVQKRYKAEGRQLFEGANAIYALQGMLSEILNDASLQTTYLLVDALDECAFGLENLLQIITDPRLSRRSNIKWLVTSRNRPDIERYLHRSSCLDRISLELNDSHVSKAVEAFVDFKVQFLADTEKSDIETQVEVQQHLCDKAEGTFLWVSLVCKELERVPLYRIREVLHEFPPGLDPLYDWMMAQIPAQNDVTTVEYCMCILRSVVLAHRPLRLEEVKITAGLTEEQFDNFRAVLDLISRCGSFLTIREDTLLLVHLSAKDYFTSGSGQQVLIGTVADEQNRIACRLLDAMNSKLRRDICNLQDPGVRIQETSKYVKHSDLPQIAYACQYWVDHLQAGEGSSYNTLMDGGNVDAFLQEHFLHWLEAMSLLQKIPEAMAAMTKLQLILNSTRSVTISELVADALRFIMLSGFDIQEAPLQAYYGALILAPERSIIRRRFAKEMPGWIKAKAGLEENWGPLLQTFEGHRGYVNSVAFSSQGDLLASASEDKTVQIWDAKIGQSLHTFEGHTDIVSSVAFSPQDDRLASASDDKTVRMWDVRTRQWLCTFEGHTQPVTSVFFSPQDDRIVSGSVDKTVRVWNSKTGQPLHTLEGHELRVTSVAFSPRSDRLVSVSYDGTVRVWGAETGQSLDMFEGCSSFTSVAFSPQGTQLALASIDNAVRVLDLNTGQPLQTLEGHRGHVNSVAFSRQGDRLASASQDTSVRVWDAKTGKLLQIFEACRGYAFSVSFSPQGDRLASAYFDSMVRMWDVNPRQSLRTFKGHTNYVHRVEFSPQGDRLVSSSHDQTVRMWDVRTGQLLHTFEIHTDIVNRVTLSPHSDLMVSSSGDGTIGVWDTKVGKLLNKIKGHNFPITSVVFSPQGDRLASASMDYTVRVWDLNTQQPRYTLEGHAGPVTSVAFSPQGDRLASTSMDYTVRVWDFNTQQPLYTLGGHEGPVTTVVFSPQGHRIASRSWDQTVRVVEYFYWSSLS